MTKLTPSVYIIVLNWNGKDDTLECLASIAAIQYADFETVVVDNGSSDDSVAAIRAQRPELHIIETGQNLGFAEGNNVGIKYAMAHHADYIFILNNDTTVDPLLLQHLVSSAQRHPDAGIIGPKTYYHAHPQVIWSAGGYWDNHQCCFEQTGDGEFDKGQYDTPQPCDFIVG